MSVCDEQFFGRSICFPMSMYSQSRSASTKTRYEEFHTKRGQVCRKFQVVAKFQQMVWWHALYQLITHKSKEKDVFVNFLTRHAVKPFLGMLKPLNFFQNSVSVAMELQWAAPFTCLRLGSTYIFVYYKFVLWSIYDRNEKKITWAPNFRENSRGGYPRG